jgi:hypothetical protein
MIESRKCQNHCVPHISEGNAATGDISIRTRVQLMLKRYLPPSSKRKIKRNFNSLMHFIKKPGSKTASRPAGPAAAAGTSPAPVPFKPGDTVRVKTLAEIQTTLDEWNECRGCMFMEAMKEYCGTIQRVLQPVERFVDERDYRVKKAKGVTLLEGLICHGTPQYGRCDRACYYFWRNEWLEKSV